MNATDSQPTTLISQEQLQQSMSYDEYLALSIRLFEQGTTTNGTNDEKILDYTRLNLSRMSRVYKTFKLQEPLREAIDKLDKCLYGLVLTESWCGDAAQSLPALARIAEESNGKIELFVKLRDKNTALMDQFLTNGGRSIPKLIFMDKDLNVLADWGPRPQAAQIMYSEAKAKKEDIFETATRLHAWYAKNKTVDLQQELADIISGL